jgi:hypothetical protein
VNQFAVPVPADQDIRRAASIGQRHHQLAAVPECKDHRPALSAQFVDDLKPLEPDAKSSSQQPDQAGPDHRQHR